METIKIMSLTELECFYCKQFFPILKFNGTLLYKRKNKKDKREIYQHTNVQQHIGNKYFCCKRCKKKYLSEILEKKYKIK